MQTLHNEGLDAKSVRANVLLMVRSMTTMSSYQAMSSYRPCIDGVLRLFMLREK